MLVVTREPGECVIVDDVIRITVTRVKGKKVRIGIEAPKDMPIRREEIARKGRESTVIAQRAKRNI